MSKRKDLLALKQRVTDILLYTPVPDDDDRTLVELNNKIQCSWKGRATVRITGKGRYALISYGSQVQEALERAGLKVYYGLYSPNTEGRYVTGPSHYYIDVPLDQERGPFGYDCP